jgi:hypothetical protein
MTKIVVNRCFGGFSLSKEAYEELGLEWDGYGFAYDDDDKRDDPKLVEVVERLGAKADGRYADLKVVEIPDDVEWTIEEYDGSEHVSEVHRTW